MIVVLYGQILSNVRGRCLISAKIEGAGWELALANGIGTLTHDGRSMDVVVAKSGPGGVTIQAWVKYRDKVTCDPHLIHALTIGPDNTLRKIQEVVTVEVLWVPGDA